MSQGPQQVGKRADSTVKEVPVGLDNQNINYGCCVISSEDNRQQSTNSSTEITHEIPHDNPPVQHNDPMPLPQINGAAFCRPAELQWLKKVMRHRQNFHKFKHNFPQSHPIKLIH